MLGIGAALYRLKFLYLDQYQKKAVFVRNGERDELSHVECISTQKSKR